MCICGSVCYCSADCQRRAWRKSHREVCFCGKLCVSSWMILCLRFIPGPVRICLDGTNTVRSAHPNSLTHSERAYFRHCTHAILRKHGEPEKLRSVRSVVVDLVTFALATKPPRIGYGDLDESAKELDDRAIQYWVKVSRGGVVYLLQVDVVSRESA